MAGYSQKSLAEKLGIKAKFKVLILNDPKNYRKDLGKFDATVIMDSKPNDEYEFIHFFTKSRVQFQKELLSLKKHLKPNGMIWISWPKKSSKVQTDLDENIIRDYALENGLVDVKVCAVDDVWSGLKLVIRLKDRPAHALSITKKKAKRYPIILASQSKARRKLMEELGIPFECHTSGYKEKMDAHKNPKILAQHLAEGKALYIARKFPESIIIGADTFITIGKKKIGKPSTIKEAKIIIKKMSGKTIEVHSGLAVIQTDSNGNATKKLVEYVLTKLKIKKMSQEEINSLAHHEEALQISGAFSIEGEGGKMVERIDGDYNNVIGLPLFQLEQMLKELKVR